MPVIIVVAIVIWIVLMGIVTYFFNDAIKRGPNSEKFWARIGSGEAPRKEVLLLVSFFGVLFIGLIILAIVIMLGFMAA